MDRLTDDQAALVFRRAAELEAARAVAPDGVMDLETVEAAGREAGLSPVAVREALADVRARGVPGTAGASVVATDAVAARTVSVPSRTVARAVVDFLEGELLVPERDLGDRAVWVPERGMEAAIERRVDALDLRDVRRLVAAVVPVPNEQRTHVRFEADVAARSLRVRVGLPVAAAVAGGGVAGAVDPLAGIGVVACGAVLGALGWSSARAAHRRASRQVTQALEAFLGWLDRA